MPKLKFISKQPINKGWSCDKKYCAITADGTKYFLRITSEKNMNYKDMFDIQQKAVSLDIPISKPIEFGTSENNIYIVEQWINGEDARFHRNLEKYEIYNGNLEKESFENIIFRRFRNWEGEGQIFECSIFQNIIENQMLYLMMTENEILDFYKKLKHILSDKPYKIIYLDMSDISSGIDIIKKERCDNNGNEVWFPLMIRYIEESTYGKKYHLTGLEGLLRHLERRKALEHRIIDEIFQENTILVKSKNYRMNDILKLL